MTGARAPAVAALALAVAALPAAPALGAAAIPRIIEVRFVPAARTQVAIWIETPDGTFLRTVKLTQSVSFLGIGNRPGAAQMNSGFRWPYGRREGTLPVWAHRRAAAPGAAQFRRVIFQARGSEGFASQTSDDSTSDPYFCLSFQLEASQLDQLDVVSCASPRKFNSDKGRYFDPLQDTMAGYAEPAEIGGEGVWRPLDAVSLYPPRRDVIACCQDRPEVAGFAADARAVMPDIDAVTMATPPGGVEQSILFSVPADWPDGAYVAFLEVNVEGDYNATFNRDSHPTPQLPAGGWDYWATNYGYPYRGQPSVVYRVPFVLGAVGSFGAAAPFGTGDLDGFGPDGGAVRPFDPTAITDDPAGAPGSGADRLRFGPGAGQDRLQVIVSDGSLCQGAAAPGQPAGLTLTPVEDVKHSHEWGRLAFVVPPSERPIVAYDVRYSGSPIHAGDATSFEQAPPAVGATVDTQALMVPIHSGAGAEVAVDFGGMRALTHYWVAIRAVNTCNVAGAHAVAELTTTRTTFTQLSGCFIATAAYGSALEPRVEALRVARDALRPRSVVAAAATDIYYQAGPAAADLLGRSALGREAVRRLLDPIVELAEIVIASPDSGRRCRPSRASHCPDSLLFARPAALASPR